MTDWEQWLRAVRVGDEIIVRHGWSEHDYLDRITAVTARHIVAGNSKFSRRTGRLTPSETWPCLGPITGEALFRFRVRDARRVLRCLLWLSDEQAVCVADYIKHLTEGSGTNDR